MSKKDIHRVVPDIEALLQKVIGGETHEVSDDDLADLASNIALKIKNSLTARSSQGKQKGVLRVSDIGKPCKRQLWYEYNKPETKAPLEPNTKIKFLFGDIIEELVLFLVKQAGHEVTHEQAKVEKDLSNGWKVKGSTDCKIDGHTIDVKSASSYSFKKFKDGTLPQNDAFGYCGQVVTYDMLLQDPSKPMEDVGFLAMDKQNGSLALCMLEDKDADKALRESLGIANTISSAMNYYMPPDKCFKEEPHQTSGNMKLGVNCSYCPFKEECWQDSNGGKGLRTFLYSNKPIFLTKVVKEPRVPEYKS